MQNRTIKLAAGLILVIMSMSTLGYVGVQRGWVYSLEVDAFVEQPRFHSQRVRLTGHVAQDAAEIKPADLVARFDLVGAATRLPVVYRGVVPPMFHPGVEAVVEGHLDENGVFQADVLMTKCASKYQSEDHANQQYYEAATPPEAQP